MKSVSQLDPKTAMPPKPRGPRGNMGRPPGADAPAMQPREGGPEGEHAAPPPHLAGGEGERPPAGPQGTNAPGRPRNFGPPMKPLTAEQVGLVRAWIDQGAK